MHMTNAYVILFFASAKTGDTRIHFAHFTREESTVTHINIDRYTVR